MTLAFTGLGSTISDLTTLGLSNANGDVGALWHVGSDFSVNILMEVNGFGTFGWEAGNAFFDRIGNVGASQHGTGSSVDVGFYWENPAVSAPEPTVILLMAVGLAGLGFSRRRKL